MKKKGFTLIELLAVIVILAIIALISVPVILNMIDSAKKSGAISSTYGYIEAVENYQAMEEVEGNTGLEEGTYNVATKTNDIPKINDLVKLKGKKPTNGTISISKGKSVTGANLCMNGYIVRYINKEAEIISSDCDELGIITEYSLDKEGWQKKRELTIRYPNGDYKYYYKVTGNAKEGENTITKNTDIETTKEVTITLLENQTVETWLVKNSKITGKDSYKEEKIDNVEIVEPEGTIKIGYPILTEKGVEASSELEITSTQEGTSPYYSLDNGATWKKYTKKTIINKSTAKIKMVRDLSKRESSIKDATKSTETITDAIGPEAYDGNEETRYAFDGTRYIMVDSSMIGKSFYIKKGALVRCSDDGNTEIVAVDKNNEKIGEGKSYCSYEGTVFIIPEGTVKIKMTGRSTLYEIRPGTEPTYEVEKIYPILTESGVQNGYDNVTIKYFNTSVQKLYKIDDGNWISYQNKVVKLETGKTIYMKGIDENGKETTVTSYKSSLPQDALGPEAYDGKEETRYAFDGTRYIMVDSSMIGKSFYIKKGALVRCSDDGNTEIVAVDKNNEKIGEGKSYCSYEGTVFIIPQGTVKIKMTGRSTLYEIRPSN